MALSDMESNIADEINRSDYTTEIAREITNSIRFYQNHRFWFNENQMITITTIQGQRYYKLPPNFGAILEARSKIGNLTYPVDILPETQLDAWDWTDTSTSNYVQAVSLFNGQVRVYPPPVAGTPIYLKGTVLLPTLTTTAATTTYAKNTAFALNDTILDPNGNIQTCVTAGTTGAAATKTYTANTAYAVNDTILDLNDNIQTCITAGTTGYELALDASLWAMKADGETTDGTVTWQLTTQLWNTNFDSYTVDGSVVWHLTNQLDNAWMSDAEELIRTRTIKQLYARYIKDYDAASLYSGLEVEALANLRMKNIGQTATNSVRPHL